MAAKRVLGWGLAVAGILGAAPWVLGRGQPSFQGSLDRISRMTQDDRAVLDRKYQQYKSLTEEERSQLRQLHLSLESDRANGGRLIEIMKDYCDWLKQIEAWQQNELAHIDDPLNRAKRVSEIHEQQQRNSSSDEEEFRGPRDLERLTLKEDQLSRMFDTLLAERQVQLSEVDQKELDAATGMKRWGLQLKHLNQQIPVDRLFAVMAPAEMKKLLESTGHPDLVRLLSESNLTKDIPENMRKEFTRRIIGRSLFSQILRETEKVSHEQLAKYLNQLPRDRQDELLKLGADEFKIRLRVLSHSQDPDIQFLIKTLPPAPRFSMGPFGGFPGFQGRPGGPGGPLNPEEGPGGRRPNGQRFDGPPFRDRRDGRGGFGPPGPPPGEEGPPPETPPGDQPPPKRDRGDEPPRRERPD